MGGSLVYHALRLLCKNTNDQIDLLSRGLKFVPTPITNEAALRKQLLTDFKDFARRMRLQFIYHGKDKNIHPFYVKSNWEPPVQQLAHTPITKAISNLPLNERKAITELKNNSEINVKKADKGTTTVIMNKLDKTQEGQTLLDDQETATHPSKTPWQGQLPEDAFLVSLDVAEPVHKYPTGRGHKLSMQSIPDFLRGKYAYPHPIPQKNP